ncbi:glycosyltransferase [Algimonas porphyrae]|uniref:N-glycosyltransferase n=1 Tax=Algimonas porphyrae TaxID=1128113 RepID=A0ABQ5V0X3_9PROT|nr:glycosyltransferase [Algimonas porphyrae]GLQ21073.1 N-glycosyltransferase [Algimonas porphyrae]
MSTLALITLPLPGHMRPMMAAARALQQAGHHPVVVGPADLTARVPDDIATRTIGQTDLPAGAVDHMCACLSRMSRLSDLRQMFRAIATLSQFYLDHLPQAIEQIGADAILHDQLEPGAGLVARSLSRSWGVRHISLACALPMNREPSVPPPFMGWRFRPSRYGAWLNAGYYRVVNALHAEQGLVLANGARRFGLTKPDDLEDWQQVWSVDDGISDQTDLVQGLASLDYPRQSPPTYLGPFRDSRDAYPGLSSIQSERDGRPLAFISLGTLMGGKRRILRAMANAATARGLQPILVHGGRLNVEQADLPTGTIARDFLDQRAIMADAAVAMLHGGYNSTTDAIAAGLPLITVPLAFEQGAIAARVERAQLGRTVGRLGSGLTLRLQQALDAVTGSPTIRAASRRAQFEALAAPGLSGLVASVDGALRQCQPRLRPVDQPGREHVASQHRPEIVPAQ